MGMSEWLQAYGLWLLFATPLCLWAMLRGWRRCTRCRQAVQRRLLRWPLLGPLMLQTCLTRWTRTLASLCAAGVPLVQALASAGQAAGHVVFEEASQSLMQDIQQGHSLSRAMSGLQLYPPMVLQLCAVGEASGTLDEMLAKAADFLDVQVQTRLASLMSLLEPALMVVLGSLIGGLVVAMYLPIFNMGQVI
jgi:type IV pilus assembly protein PilC